MQHPDQKYIDALVNNDAGLIEELYQKYSYRIKSMVLKNNGSETDAADVFQDTLLSIFQKAKSKSFTLTCPIDAFLYLACKNKWLNELNKRKSRVTINESVLYNTNEDCFKLCEELNLQQERNDLLAAKLNELCKDCRELLKLSWSGKTMEEVAGILNITYGYARKRKCECMSELIILVKCASQFNSLKW